MVVVIWLLLASQKSLIFYSYMKLTGHNSLFKETYMAQQDDIPDSAITEKHELPG